MNNKLEKILTEIKEKHKLSPREFEVICLLSTGVTKGDDIAKKLGISPNTVRIHNKNINQKLGVGSSKEILAMIIGMIFDSDDLLAFF